MKNISIVSFEKKHIEEAILLLKAYYQAEKKEVDFLPSFDCYIDLIKKNLEILAHKNEGISMIEDGKLIGYLTGYPIESLFGNPKGIFVPVFGHAAIYSRRLEIEEALYINAAEKWVKDQILTHSLAIFATDKTLLEQWYYLGFGLRCVDAIKKIQTHQIHDNSYQYEEITKENKDIVKDLHEKHHLYYRTSPIFMPNEDEDALDDLNDWLDNPNHRMFCIKKDDNVYGYIRFQLNGESLFSIHPSNRSITGLFVLPKYRNQGIGEKLLQYVENILSVEQFQLLGVDFESINPKANKFWHKYFQAYSHSLVRRIDERIVPFLK